MDEVLAKYRKKIRRRTGLRFPRFAKEAVHTAPVLAILESPAKSGAEKTGCCSLNNNDPTATRNREAIKSIDLQCEEIVFWNLYAAFDTNMTEKHKLRRWAGELDALVAIMPNVKAILAFGNVAWLGMRHLNLRSGVALIWAPHPSNRGRSSNPHADEELKSAWNRAKALLN